MISSEDTIFAVSSGAGKSGIAVIRLSGPSSGPAIALLAGEVPKPRMASLRTIRDRNGDAIDQGLILWFPAPASFSGEDMAEIHVHGSRAVIAAVLEILATIDGTRAAQAGEFARRAFSNGKLDLTEVEGLADLIDAETVQQRRQAIRQLEGHAGQVFEDWRNRLIAITALCEVGIDFADEDDVPAEIGRTIGPDISSLFDEMKARLDDRHRGEMIRDGLTVVIAGPPNAGKSSLINAMARRDIAIVSTVPGTTRDALEARIDLSGVPVTVVDTAGIREAVDEVEIEGVRRAEMRVETADLVLWLAEPGSDSHPEWTAGTTVWDVETKVDLVPGALAGRRGPGRFAISVKADDGLDEMLEGLARWIGERVGGGADVLITRVRHRHELSLAAAALERAMVLDYMAQSDLVAEELRGAARALGRITGRIDVEDILDAIFRDFCIGK